MLELEELLAYVCVSIIIFTICLMIGTTVLLKKRNKLSFFIWHLISWVSFIKWTALINSSSPQAFLQFFKSLLKILKPKSFNSFGNYSTVPLRFSELGINHSYFLNNAELIIIIFTTILVVYLIFFFIKSERIGHLRTVFCHNLIIRGVLLLYIDLSICAFLQISRFEITTIYGIINSIISVVVLSSLIIITVFFTVLMQIEDKMGNNLKVSNFSTLTSEFKKGKIIFRFYYLFFMLERFICPLGYALLDREPIFQCLVTGIFVGIKCKSYLVFYVLFFKPFITITLNYLVISLDFITLTIVGLITSYLIPMEDSSKTGIFYFILFLITAAVFINIFLFFIEAWNVQHNIKSENNNEPIQFDSNQKVGDFVFNGYVNSIIDKAGFKDDSHFSEDIKKGKNKKAKTLNNLDNIQNTEISVIKDISDFQYEDSVNKVKKLKESKNYRNNFISSSISEDKFINEKPSLQSIFINKFITRRGSNINKKSLNEISENKVNKIWVNEENLGEKIKIEDINCGEVEMKTWENLNDDKKFIKNETSDIKNSIYSESIVNEETPEPLDKRIPFYNNLLKKYNKF